MRHVRSGYIHTFPWENRRSTGATIGPVLAIAEVLRVVRAVLSLSLIQPRSRLPVTPLRPAEHYHTYGELEDGGAALCRERGGRGGDPGPNFTIFMWGRLRTEADAVAGSAAHEAVKQYQRVEAARLAAPRALLALRASVDLAPGASTACAAVFGSADFITLIASACDGASLVKLACVSRQTNAVLMAQIRAFREQHVAHIGETYAVIGMDGLVRETGSGKKKKSQVRGPSNSVFGSFSHCPLHGARTRTVEDEPTSAPDDDWTREQITEMLSNPAFPGEGKALWRLADALFCSSHFDMLAAIVQPSLLGGRTPIKRWSVASGLETPPSPMPLQYPTKLPFSKIITLLL